MRNVIIIFIILVGTVLKAQEEKRNHLYIAFGIGGVKVFQNENYKGYPIYGGQFNSVELKYVHYFVPGYRVIHNWGIETGIIYSYNNSIVVTPPRTNDEIIKIISIPIYTNFKFAKYFFINGGPLLSLELDMDEDSFGYRSEQTGIGFGFGFGGEYRFNKNISGFFNPFMRLHNIKQLYRSDYKDALMEVGVKFGFLYKI